MYIEQYLYFLKYFQTYLYPTEATSPSSSSTAKGFLDSNFTFSSPWNKYE